MKEYSPYSKYQDESQHIEMNIAVGDSPLLTPDCFTHDLLLKANPMNDSLVKIACHLSWGDIENTKFFTEQILNVLKSIKVNKNIDYHLKVLEGLLSI
jgi:hypothetical protein